MSKKHTNQTGPFLYSTNPELMKELVHEEEETLPPGQQKLKIKLDTKARGGKVVKIIEKLVRASADLETLGKMLKTKCGTGGSVKEGNILIQGDYKNKVVQLLQQLQYKVS